MSTLVKNIFRFILFIMVQRYVLNQIPPLHQFITPYLYFLYIIWLPFGLSRGALMLIAFLFGFTLDYFLSTNGLHAAPCVLIAYLRPFIISLLLRKEGGEQNYASPSVTSMGWAPYCTLVIILTFFHHAYLVFLEWMQFGTFLYFLGKVSASMGISLLLIFITEIFFFRKEKYRTNAM
jgi:hypothetical protein